MVTFKDFNHTLSSKNQPVQPNKHYHRKALLSSFGLNGETWKFHVLSQNVMCIVHHYNITLGKHCSVAFIWMVAWENSPRHCATPSMVSREMTFEKRTQKFDTDDVSLPRSGWCFWLIVPRGTQIWVVTRHQYGISVLDSQTSFHGETIDGVAKCRLSSQATISKVTQ